jgi:hypothetical protein
MAAAASILKSKGICTVPNAYTTSEIDSLNNAVDNVFAQRSSGRRSYVHVDELQEMGLLGIVFGAEMRRTLFSIMPDPVLYHCFVIETAGNDTEPNLFANTLSGWHRDADCSFSPLEPTHVSIFVYLSDVARDDGAFEFAPQDPRGWLRSSTPTVLVTGRSGYTFAWERSYYHRASPNRGPRRRRLVKISIQRNAFVSAHLANSHFIKAIRSIDPGDPELDVLFGRFQGRTAPQILPSPEIAAAAIEVNGTLGIADTTLLRGQIRRSAAAAKAQARKVFGRTANTAPAYD